MVSGCHPEHRALFQGAWSSLLANRGYGPRRHVGTTEKAVLQGHVPTMYIIFLNVPFQMKTHTKCLHFLVYQTFTQHKTQAHGLDVDGREREE